MNHTLAYNIAVVDDDPMMLSMMQLMLEDLGNTKVKTYKTGEDFLDDFEMFEPQLLVVDYHLDSEKKDAMTGSDVIDKLHNKGIQLPVIVASSQRDMEIAIKLLKYQVVDYIEKTNHFVVRLEKSVLEVLKVIELNQMKVGTEVYLKKDSNHLLKTVAAFVVGGLLILLSQLLF